MRRVMDRVRQFAQQDSPILIEGERGCGKSWIAHLIHQASPHAHSPLYNIACAENSGEMLASLLKNIVDVLTGERSSDNGPGMMLILNEVEKLSISLQEQLCEAIEQCSSRAPEKPASKLRVIAVTRDELRVAGSTFNRNLVEQFNKCVIKLPPLRERREDILVLADHFLDLSIRESHREKIIFTPEARQALMAHRWPANIRELRTVVERAATIVEGSAIDVMDLALRQPSRNSHALSEEFLSLDAVERIHIQRVLHATSSPEEAAILLKIDILTLWRKRRRYGV